MKLFLVFVFNVCGSKIPNEFLFYYFRVSNKFICKSSILFGSPTHSSIKYILSVYYFTDAGSVRTTGMVLKLQCALEPPGKLIKYTCAPVPPLIFSRSQVVRRNLCLVSSLCDSGAQKSFRTIGLCKNIH